MTLRNFIQEETNHEPLTDSQEQAVLIAIDRYNDSIIPRPVNEMRQKFDKMINFAVWILEKNSDSIKSQPEMTVKDFRIENASICKMILDDCKSAMNFDLGTIQLDEAIGKFLKIE